MKFLVLLGLTIAISHGATIPNAQCDPHKFGICTTAFAQQLGLPDMPSDAAAFIKAMVNLIESKGLAGMKQICGAMIYLQSCLGDQYKTCLTMDFLQSIGVKAGDAAEFITLAAQQQYVCTTGWSTFVDNFKCISTVASGSQQELMKCMTDYAQNMSKDPVNACKYNQGLADCYTAPFKQQCDQSVAKLLCSSMKAGFVPVFPQCSVKCN